MVVSFAVNKEGAWWTVEARRFMSTWALYWCRWPGPLPEDIKLDRFSSIPEEHLDSFWKAVARELPYSICTILTNNARFQVVRKADDVIFV
jgi:hypothetical protein